MKRWAKLFLVAMVAAAWVGCDDDEGGAAEGGAGGATQTHLDLMAMAHLADIDREGLYIDFGTPAQNKYTVGDWNAGWGSRGHDGDRTFANVGRRGRIFFHLDDASPRYVTLQLRPRGTRAVSPYINGQAIQSVFFEGESWQTVGFALPAEHLQEGDNQLLLSFGGVTNLGGEDVSVQLGSVRVTEGSDAPSGDLLPPDWGTYTGAALMGEVSKNAITLGTPGSLRFYAEIPEAAKLLFAVAQEGAAGGSARITVEPEGGSARQVFEHTLTGEWHDAEIELSAFAGKVVRLTFEGTGGEGRVAWGEPRIGVAPQSEPEIEPAQNVVVVLVDTLRASKLKAFNPSSRVRTPVLDELAEESAVFARAQSTENWTKPAVGAILTGLHPMDHGARTQGAVLSDEATMLSEHFKAEGFATAGLIANGYISDRFGFDQGWDHYKNYIREAGASSEAEDVFREAGDWAVAHGDERFFLYVHTIDPHVPYDPEEEFVSMYDRRSDYDGQVQPRMTGELLHDAKRNPPRVTFTESDVQRLQALHDGEITQHDRHMGTFIERLKEAGLWENTVFVFVADHGEEFDEHGSWGHGHSIYQELIHVPFLVHKPGAVPARRIGTTVSTIDLAPTVLELAGLDPMPGIAGRSLMPLLSGGTRSGPEVAMSEFLDERRVMVGGPWKLIVRGNLTSSLFDLQRDPGEQNQLDLVSHPIAARYLRILQGQFLGATDRSHWLDATQRQGQRFVAGDAQMDDELQQQLRELGYLD
jgi:choline-sulfatase